MVEPAPVSENWPAGFGFRPTDEELFVHYLQPKLKGDPSVHRIIPEIDVCKYEPWDLPAFSEIISDDPEWFFFSPRDYKYSNSTRSNRATSRGFWKPTGNDRKIQLRGTNSNIGTKKTLVFYEGRVPYGVKTNWVIHEYHDLTFPAHRRTYVLCRLIKRPEKITEGKTYEIVYYEGEPSRQMISEDENPEVSEDENPEEQHCFSNMDSEIHTRQRMDEFVNSMIQPPLKLDEFADSSIQTIYRSDEFVNSTIQTQHEPYKFMESIIQTPHESYKFMDSTIYTSHESYEFLDSSILKSYESDFLLELPPSVDDLL